MYVQAFAVLWRKVLKQESRAPCFSVQIRLPCIGKISSIAVIDKTLWTIARRHATRLEYCSATDAATTVRNVGNDEVSEGRLADEDEPSRRNRRLERSARVGAGINPGRIGRGGQSERYASGENELPEHVTSLSL
jgi:hypothetical protein